MSLPNVFHLEFTAFDIPRPSIVYRVSSTTMTRRIPDSITSVPCASPYIIILILTATLTDSPPLLEHVSPPR
jgi:hypothetical protein